MAGVIALIDGEHHPSAVRDALERLAAEHTIHGVVFCGGEEKLAPGVLERPEAHYGMGVVVAADRAAALRALGTGAPVDAVVDLADEPVLDASAKLELACVALDLGLRFVGADFELRPPVLRPLGFDAKALAVFGTGKRTGKTALAGHWAALLRERGVAPVIVSMGRGGPAEPQLAMPGTALGDLLAISRGGSHAASDYLEDAVLAGVPTVGCRRVGGGLAGAAVASNVEAGLELARSLEPEVVLVEGSGAVVPPVVVDAGVCVVGSRVGALCNLGPYRLLRADLTVVTATEADGTLVGDLERFSRGPVVRIELLPEPAEPIPDGARVAFFSTGAGAPAGIETVVASRNLARREPLADDLARARAERCDLYLTELKAAAIDTVAEAAQRAGAAVRFARNRPRSLPGEPDLDAALLDLYNGL